MRAGAVVDWVALLGPGGLIVLIVAVDRIMRARSAARNASLEVVNDAWQEILKERETEVRVLRSQIRDLLTRADYWRERAAIAEFNCRVNGVALPEPDPEPKFRP